MRRRVTFIHAADLHLGAPFRGLRRVSGAWADLLVEAIAQAYERVVDAAIARKVDFVVFAGDVFDTTNASYGDYLRFFDGLERLGQAGIPSFLVTGNHDPYVSWAPALADLPASATMLPADRPGFSLLERDGEPLCIVAGRGYHNKIWPADQDIAEGLTRDAAVEALSPTSPRVSEAPFCVGVLHTGLHLDPTKAPSDPQRLLSSGMDYWALGHIHQPYLYPSEQDPRLVFSGCVQGRDIRETGARGVYCVTLTEGAPNRAEFIPTASVAWQRLDVDVADCATLSDVADKALGRMFRENGAARCDRMVSRITLVGAAAVHEVLARPGVLEDLRRQVNDAYPEFFCDALVDATTAVRDKDALRQEGLFPAVFLQVAQAQREHPDQQVDYLQDEFLRRGRRLPGSCARAADDLAAEAEDLVLDLLAQGGRR